MPDDVFFDTNVLIYAVALSDRRNARAEELLESGGRIGVQNLNEFVSVARRKLSMPWRDVRRALEAFVSLCPSPIALTTNVQLTALRIAERHGFEFYDALVVSAAIEAGCATLYSEDFQDGQKLPGGLTIRDPFA